MKQKERAMGFVTPNLHKKILDMCDCYMESDYSERLRGMAGQSSVDTEEDAIKYLALTILFGVTEGAAKLSFTKKGDVLSVVASSAKGEQPLPVPHKRVGDALFSVMQGIMHHGEGTKSLLLSLAIGGNPFEVMVKLQIEEGRKSFELYLEPAGQREEIVSGEGA